MKNKKVVLATGIYPPDIGGPATYVKKLEEEFKDRLWNVSIVAYGDKKIINKDFIVISRKQFFLFKYVNYFYHLWRASFRGDFIYAFDLGSSGFSAFIVSLLTFKPLVLRIGGDLLWEGKALRGYKKSMDDFYNLGEYRCFKFFIMKLILKRAKVVFIPAQSLAYIYKKYYGVSEDSLNILPNVVEVRAYQKNNTGTKKILFAGRLVQYKNIDVLIKLVKDINYETYIVGNGPEKKYLEDLIKENNLENKVWIYNYLPKNDLYELIKSCDLGISLSQVEYNPNFILECLSFGLPVLLNKDNGLTLKLPKEFLVDVNSGSDIKNKINYIFDNYDKSLDLVKEYFKPYSFEESFESMMNFLNKKSIC